MGPLTFLEQVMTLVAFYFSPLCVELDHCLHIHMLQTHTVCNAVIGSMQIMQPHCCLPTVQS
jgi:hypothetical protein